MARLDRLSSTKEVAQIGAVIGREFSYDLLAAVAGIGEHALLTALDQLNESELVFRRGTPPAATYVFKHALVQDAAYQSLLRGRRQQLHSRIANALRNEFRDGPVAGPEIIAQHYTAAGLAEEAVPYWHQAGDKALARFANLEAVAHLERGSKFRLICRRVPTETSTSFTCVFLWAMRFPKSASLMMA